VLPEALAVKAVERLAVPALLVGHVVEKVGGGREVGTKALREALVDPRVLFLVRDSERQDLALRQLRQRLHAPPPFRKVLNENGAREFPVESGRRRSVLRARDQGGVDLPVAEIERRAPREARLEVGEEEREQHGNT
jgi:hypothetical protein